jgi:DNA polymerase-3 subunit delta
VFDLTLAIGGKDRGRLLAILARNLEAGEAPLRILGSLAWQYRRLWKVKEVVRQGGREGEAARTLRMDPYKVREFLDQFPDAHLHEALRLFLDADAKLKGGSGGRPARILEDVLLRLCARAQVNVCSSSSPGRGTDVPQPVRARTISNVRTITRGKQTRS